MVDARVLGDAEIGAERQFLEDAAYAELKRALKSHLEQTRSHVERVEKVFQMHGAEPAEVDCPAIDGILEEADEVSGEIEDKAVLDAAIIASAQAVEHYEITRYGTLASWAETLGHTDNRLYDGSWAEWGALADTPVVTGKE